MMNNPMGQMSNMLGQLMNGGNPMQSMFQLFGGNPAMNRAMEMANGKDEQQLKQTVMNLSNQMGVNMQPLINMAQMMGIKL